MNRTRKSYYAFSTHSNCESSVGSTIPDL